jgi:hypothetical protein
MKQIDRTSLDETSPEQKQLGLKATGSTLSKIEKNLACFAAGRNVVAATTLASTT